MSRKVAIIVGNGSLQHDVSTAVDKADFVMRFNEPNLSGGLSGVRTDKRAQFLDKAADEPGHRQQRQRFDMLNRGKRSLCHPRIES